MAKGTKSKARSNIGGRSRLTHRKMAKLFDRQTAEFIANVRWRKHGELYIEPAKHVQIKVVPDPKA